MPKRNPFRKVVSILGIGFIAIVLVIGYYGNQIVDELKLQRKVAESSLTIQTENEKSKG